MAVVKDTGRPLADGRGGGIQFPMHHLPLHLEDTLHSLCSVPGVESMNMSTNYYQDDYG